MASSDLHTADIVVAGHICLDIILSFQDQNRSLSTILTPGKCVIVEGAQATTGGAVGNTGRALYQLGIPTRLVAKLGKDTFGDAMMDILNQSNPCLTEGMIIDADSETSYTIVLNPAGEDRSFLHFPGANETFCTKDVSEALLEDARFFHFGYPPELPMMYKGGANEAVQLIKKVKNLGLTTSMDMALPDTESPAGKVDWIKWLSQVLPFVDIFFPSFDELYFMLDRDGFERFKEGKDSYIPLHLVESFAKRLIQMGATVVVIKLGVQGLFLHTTDDREQIKALGKGKPHQITTWTNIHQFVPCFATEVAGTNGAGDCTIAGFLAGLSKQLPPEETMRMATAVGAFSVERADASSGVPHWDVVMDRVQAGWKQLEIP